MPFYKFESGELLYNQIKTHPQCRFVIYDRKIFYNNDPQEAGQFVNNVGCTPPGSGSISLYEMNVDRTQADTGLIYPFIVKGSSLASFVDTTTTDFNNASYGDEIIGAYPLSASISSDLFPSGHQNITASALQNTLNDYRVLNPQFAYSSSFGDKSTQELRLISIPSIYYGSSIKKGSVSLKFIVTGSVVAELADDKRDGVLRQTALTSSTTDSSHSGSVAGFVLYNHGFILLTGSWNIGDNQEPYIPGSSAIYPRWLDFAATGSTGTNENLPSSSFQMDFDGVNYVPNLTMFATARKGEVNSSNNPSSLTFNPITNESITSGSISYSEPTDQTIKSIVSSSYTDPAPPFEKTVFINQIGIYDEDKNLIAIAKLAKPVRKRDTDDITFKLKMDF